MSHRSGCRPHPGTRAQSRDANAVPGWIDEGRHGYYEHRGSLLRRHPGRTMSENLTIVCSHCKQSLAPEAHFCHHCGAPSGAANWAASGDENFVKGLFNLARGLASTLDVDALLKRIGQSAEQMFL